MATATATATLPPLPTSTPIPTATIPATATPIPAPTTDSGAFYFVYPVPSTDSVPVAAITPGQQLGLLGRTADGTWVQVSLSEGVTGWVLAELVEAVIEVSLLPIVTP